MSSPSLFLSKPSRNPSIPEGYARLDYDYDLPPELVAQYPLEKRDHSRMMTLNKSTGAIAHHRFDALPNFLQAGDLLVVNNTRVLPAKLAGRREGYTGKIELLMMHPSPEDPTVWEALAKPAKRLQSGVRLVFEDTANTFEVLKPLGEGRVLLQAHLKDTVTVEAWLEKTGEMPIPPYLNRASQATDRNTYQTVYAQVSGSQAAPTAGLHFTPEVLTALQQKGVRQMAVTLTVSTGTFRSMYAEDIREHEMDPEQYCIGEETAQIIAATREAGGRIVAVGTTVAKTLETSAFKHAGKPVAESDWSNLFIYPGFRFQVVDALLTNFHLPQSTLLMLVSAFTGREAIRAAYQEAVLQRYRFFSYGDCMLIQA